MMEEIKAMREQDSSLIFFQRALIGEGFDLPELCTLVLAVPLSFKGRLYNTRGARRRAPERTCRIYDCDVTWLGVPARMATYRKWDIPSNSRPTLPSTTSRYGQRNVRTLP